MMKLLPLLPLLSLFATVIADENIVGGDDARIEDYPYQHHQPRLDLTAAHCIQNSQIDPRQVYVRAGSTAYSSGGTYIWVSSATVHPDFNPRNDANDIAVLKLGQPLSLNDLIAPVTLPGGIEGLPADGTPVNVTGWDQTESGPNSPTLKVLHTQVVNKEYCRTAFAPYTQLTDTVLCAGSLNGCHGNCFGDSGGPLVGDGIQLGIVSFSKGCARPGLPTVYTNVFNFRSWIIENTGVSGDYCS